jgi:hypothetical protein
MIGPGKGSTLKLLCHLLQLSWRLQRTRPCSIDPASGSPFGRSFPLITIWEIWLTCELLVQHLGISCIMLSADPWGDASPGMGGPPSGPSPICGDRHGKTLPRIAFNWWAAMPFTASRPVCRTPKQATYTRRRGLAVKANDRPHHVSV